MKKKLIVLLPLFFLTACTVETPKEEHYSFETYGAPVVRLDSSSHVTYLSMSRYGQLSVDGDLVVGVNVPELFLENTVAYEAAAGSVLPEAVSTVDSVTFRGWYTYKNNIYPEKVTNVPMNSGEILYAIFDGPIGGGGGVVTEGYGLKFSDGTKVSASHIGMNDEGYDEYLVSNYSFEAGKSFSLYNFENDATWAVDLNPWSFGDTAGSGTIWKQYLSKGATAYTVLQNFRADVYIKLKYEADNVYFGLKQEDRV